MKTLNLINFRFSTFAMMMLFALSIAFTGCTVDEDFSTPNNGIVASTTSKGDVVNSGGGGHIKDDDMWGFVTNTSNHRINSAQVDLIPIGTNISIQTTITDQNGDFNLTDVDPGQYNIVFSKPGLQNVIISVTKENGQGLDLGNIVME